MWFFKKKEKISEVSDTPTISETAGEGYKVLREEMEKSPRVPDDMRAEINFAAGMNHSIFHDLYVREAVVKAYKRGYTDGEKKEKVVTDE